MKGHVVLPGQDADGKWFAKCNCGWSPGPNHFEHRWEAEDQIANHLDNVERAKANLHRGRASMLRERDWAKERLEDPTTLPKDRDMWQILYDGFNQRLNDTEPVQQDGLF